MSYNPEILTAVNRAIDALSDLKLMLEKEAAEAESTPETPAEETAAPIEPEVQEEPAPIELIAPEKPEPLPAQEKVELVHPEAAEKAPQEEISLAHPESVTASEKRTIELVLTDPESIIYPDPVPPADPAPAEPVSAPAPAAAEKTPVQNMTCPRCGKKIDHGFKFCMYCGQQLNVPGAAPQTCKACGKQLRPGNRFCVYCGTPAE